MLKVLHIIPSLCKGGAERIVLDICIELQKREYVKVKLIILHPINEYEFLSKQIDVECCNSKVGPSISGKSQVNLIEFIKIINDFKPDIIHSHLFEAEMLSRWELFSGIKYFSHCHNNMPELKSFNYHIFFNKRMFTNLYEKKIIEKKYKKCNNQFIVVSKNSFDYYSNNLTRSLQKNIHLLPNAIDYKKFYYPYRKEIKDIVNLIMVGHMSENKNQIFLIDVLQKLRNANVNAFLTLLGDWRDNGIKIKNKAKELELEAYLSMPGKVKDVETQLKYQHIYVHSSKTESFGLTIIEAMAAGLPVVCLDGGGNRDIIEQGKNGFILYNQNVANFTDKIIQLIENRELYQAMSSYAKEYAKKYDIKDYVDKLLDMYKKSMK